MSKESLEKIANNFKGKDILSLNQFDPSSIKTVLRLSQSFATDLAKGKTFDLLKGVLGTLLFYEPSSRTMASFDAAIKRLGGQTTPIINPQQFSSVAKGETLEDTVRVFAAYSDLIVIRHPEMGTAEKAARVSDVPILNAGDGTGEHPTQALLDMYTIYEKFGKLEGLNILCAGDLLNGRTIHSLLKGLSMYKNNKVYLLSPSILKLGVDFVKELKQKGLQLIEIEHEDEMPQDAHVWYWTRVQKERFTDMEEYEKVKYRFTITPELLKEKGNKDMIIMHPLPRVGEIDVRIDTDPRAWYLPKEVKNGMFVRMALAGLVMGRI